MRHAPVFCMAFRLSSRSAVPRRGPRLDGSRRLSSFEVQHDRVIRSEQVGEDLLAAATVLPAGRWSSRNGQSGSRTDRRQHALEILERGAAKVLIVGVQPAKGDLQRLGRQHEREQREDVRQALAGAAPDEVVDEGRRLAVVEASSRRRPSHTGRPTATSFCTTSKTRAASMWTSRLRGTIAASERPHWKRTSKRMSSSPSSRLSTARCERQTANTRGIRRRTAKSSYGIEQRIDECADVPRRDLAQRTRWHRRRPDPRRAAG